MLSRALPGLLLVLLFAPTAALRPRPLRPLLLRRCPRRVPLWIASAIALFLAKLPMTSRRLFIFKCAIASVMLVLVSVLPVMKTLSAALVAQLVLITVIILAPMLTALGILRLFPLPRFLRLPKSLHLLKMAILPRAAILPRVAVLSALALPILAAVTASLAVGVPILPVVSSLCPMRSV